MIEISARRPLRLSGSLRNGHFSLVTQETYADRNETAQRSSYRTRVMFCVYNSSFLAGSVRNQFLILSIPKAQLKNKITCFLIPNSLPFLSQYLFPAKAIEDPSDCHVRQNFFPGYEFLFYFLGFPLSPYTIKT